MQHVELKQFPYFQNLSIPQPYSEVSVGLTLIGIDHAYLIKPLEIRSGANNQPFAMLTTLGWTLCGSLNCQTTRDVVSNCAVTDHLIHNSGAFEACDANKLALSEADKGKGPGGPSLYDESVQHVDCHYDVPTLWKGEHMIFPIMALE